MIDHMAYCLAAVIVIAITYFAFHDELPAAVTLAFVSWFGGIAFSRAFDR